MNRYNLTFLVALLAAPPLALVSAWLSIAAALVAYALLAVFATKSLDRLSHRRAILRPKH